MAVTTFTKGFRITGATAADILNHANVGMGTNIPSGARYVARVSAIHLVAGAAPTATTIRADGSGGVPIISHTPAANTTTAFVFSTPTDIGDLAVTALGANTEVIVFTA